jgi:hypothetical protein
MGSEAIPYEDGIFMRVSHSIKANHTNDDSSDICIPAEYLGITIMLDSRSQIRNSAWFREVIRKVHDYES